MSCFVEAHQSMYPKVVVKEQVHDHVESLGLRYLVHFGVENVAPDESYAKTRQICVSKLAMRTFPIAKGSGKIEHREIKDVDHVVQRPRAVLSSPDNDYLIGKMNEKAFKRVSTPKPHASGKVNVVHVDVGKARVTLRDNKKTNDGIKKGLTPLSHHCSSIANQIDFLKLIFVWIDHQEVEQMG
ncbi:unnamed protein product [Lactuca saligna]|uniref:Uncharacterized protein n=1 Tax=Lactuca saligna TaxID=75948 RepID=A0AA35ZZY9_LACSI|nr:unnamed protein product [Lactuca saligna]